MGKHNKRNPYGWDFQKAVAHISLPPKIKCDGCERHLGTTTNYSEGQRTKARLAISERGVNARFRVKCHRCSVGCITEIECVHCGITKGRDAFAKSQRKDPGNAKCYECVEEQVSLEPINEDIYEGDLSKAFVTPDYSAGKMPDYWSNTKSNRSIATTSQWEGSDKGDDGGVSIVSAIGKMSLGQGSQTNPSTHGTLIDTDDGHSSAGKGGFVRRSGNTYADSVTSSGGWASNVANCSETQYSSSGFAKIKAYKTEKAPVPEEEDWKSSSGEEDDDEDSDSDEDREI